MQTDAAARLMLPVLSQRAFFCTVSVVCESVDTPGSSGDICAVGRRARGCACMYVCESGVLRCEAAVRAGL